MCIANVHSNLFQKQSVHELQALCQSVGVWLHLEGHALSALTLLPPGDAGSAGTSPRPQARRAGRSEGTA
jgi:hypothetical protein